MAATDSGIEAFDNDSDQSARLSRVAKTYVGVKSTAIASDLVQLTGGIAVTWEHDLHLYERRIAVNRAVYGTPEQLRRAIHRCLGSETVRCTDSTAVTGGRE
jgi:alkylation response protein AidB-like acyl-CoA dehydrogenase